jgi:hypothetical protein
MPDNPIGVAGRRKRLVWGALIRVDDAAVIGGNDQRKIGASKTLKGLVRDNNRGCALEQRVGIGTHQQLLVYMNLLTSIWAAVAALKNKGAPIDESRHVLLKQDGRCKNRVKSF